MSAVVIAGDTSGVVTLQAPSVAGSTTLNLPATSGSLMVNGPAFSAYQSVAQTNLTSLATVKVLFQTEEFDTNANYDTSTSRFTPTVAGYYQVSSTVTVALNSTAALALTILYKNGAALKGGALSVGTSSGFPRSTVSSLIYMNGSTDYLESYVYGTAGGNFSTNAAVDGTFFQAVLVRGA